MNIRTFNQHNQEPSLPGARSSDYIVAMKTYFFYEVFSTSKRQKNRRQESDIVIRHIFVCETGKTPMPICLKGSTKLFRVITFLISRLRSN